MKAQSKENATNRRENTMTTIDIQAITSAGCVVYASLELKEDYTMNQLVQAVRDRGFQAFRITATMRRFVYI